MSFNTKSPTFNTMFGKHTLCFKFNICCWHLDLVVRQNLCNCDPWDRNTSAGEMHKCGCTYCALLLKPGFQVEWSNISLYILQSKYVQCTTVKYYKFHLNSKLSVLSKRKSLLMHILSLFCTCRDCMQTRLKPKEWVKNCRW